MERLNLRLCLGAATLVCVTAGLCFGITATTGFAARTSRSVRIPLYTNAVFPGAALTCTMGNHRKGYRLVFCRRSAGTEGGIWVYSPAPVCRCGRSRSIGCCIAGHATPSRQDATEPHRGLTDLAGGHPARRGRFPLLLPTVCYPVVTQRGVLRVPHTCRLPRPVEHVPVHVSGDGRVGVPKLATDVLGLGLRCDPQCSRRVPQRVPVQLGRPSSFSLALFAARSSDRTTALKCSGEPSSEQNTQSVAGEYEERTRCSRRAETTWTPRSTSRVPRAVLGGTSIPSRPRWKRTCRTPLERSTSCQRRPSASPWRSPLVADTRSASASSRPWSRRAAEQARPGRDGVARRGCAEGARPAPGGAGG